MTFQAVESVPIIAKIIRSFTGPTIYLKNFAVRHPLLAIYCFLAEICLNQSSYGIFYQESEMTLIVEWYPKLSGQWAWRIRSDVRDELLAVSAKDYTNEADCVFAIEQLKHTQPDAKTQKIAGLFSSPPTDVST